MPCLLNRLTVCPASTCLPKLPVGVPRDIYPRGWLQPVKSASSSENSFTFTRASKEES